MDHYRASRRPSRRLTVVPALLVFSLAVAACRDTSHHDAVNKAGITASHGGTMFALPGGKGFVEFVIGELRPATRARSGVVAAYFLQPDGSGPLDPAPTDVSCTHERGKPIKLFPKAGHFASEPGPYAPGRDWSGELTGSIRGETFSLHILTR